VHVLRRRKNEERGAAAVEFALVGIIMVTLIALTIQFAALFWGYQAASSAAREAARFGAVQPCDNAAIIARGNLRVDEVAPVSGSTGFTSVTSGVPVQVGDQLTVRVSFTTFNIVPLPGTWPSINKTATTRVENIPAGGC
jgi:Flp pilus assembly protein TadG